MSRGGYRHNAGRPKGSRSSRTVIANEARQILIQKIVDKWEPIIEAKMRLALGTYYIETANGRKPRIIYKAKPDSKSLIELIEFVVGKSKQSIELSAQAFIDSPSIQELSKNIKAILETKP